MLGELILEFKGKSTGIWILAEGKSEGSSAGSGTIMRKEATEMDIGVLTLMTNGVLMMEGNSMIMTADGDVVMMKNRWDRLVYW